MLESLPFRVAAFGGILAIFGSIVGPFTKVGDVSAKGTESGHNGTIIIVLSVLTVLALATALMRAKRGASAAGVLLAAVAGLGAFLDWGDVSEATDQFGGLAANLDVSRGWGLYVATAGCVLLFLGALGTLLMGREGPG